MAKVGYYYYDLMFTKPGYKPQLSNLKGTGAKTLQELAKFIVYRMKPHRRHPWYYKATPEGLVKVENEDKWVLKQWIAEYELCKLAASVGCEVTATQRKPGVK